MSQSVDSVIDAALANKKIVGMEVLATQHGKVIYHRAAGHFDREAGIPMPKNAIYRLASLTKPIVAMTALAMIERSLLQLDDAVSSHLPYFTPRSPDGSFGDIRVRHLLTHTAGLGYGYRGDPELTTGLQDTDLDHEANFTRLARQPLLFAPGTAWNYSTATDVLGAVLAKVHGTTLADAVRHYVTGPLGMSDSNFSVGDVERLAVPYGDDAPEPARMTARHSIRDANGDEKIFAPNRIFNPKAFQSGGAGMASTASDFLLLLEGLRSGGQGIIGSELLTAAMSNQIGELPRDAGRRFGYLGAIVADPVAAETPEAVGSVNWGGVYGHSWLVDPANGFIMISMSNTALEGCTGRYPRDVRDALYADFVRRP
ncbi:serine hydrolase domain-containing protein [Devosia sp. A449]